MFPAQDAPMAQPLSQSLQGGGLSGVALPAPMPELSMTMPGIFIVMPGIVLSLLAGALKAGAAPLRRIPSATTRAPIRRANSETSIAS
jgi:hypothetical protein